MSVMFLKILSISCISAFKNTAAKCNHSRHKLMLSVSFFIVKTSSEVKVLWLKPTVSFEWRLQILSQNIQKTQNEQPKKWNTNELCN